MTAPGSLDSAPHLIDAPLLRVLARATSPAERIAGGWLQPAGTPGVAQERLLRWSQRIADNRPERVVQVLEEHGLTLDQWLLGLSDVTVVPGAPLPIWAQEARALLDLLGTSAEPPNPPRLGELAGDGLPAWMDPDQPWPFYPGFRDWMVTARRDVDAWSAGAPIAEGAKRELVLDFARRLLSVSGPLLIEAAARRPASDPLFVQHPRADWEGLWSSYPVVARLLATASRQWRESTAELCARIATDLRTLCPGVGVAGIELSAGDHHDGGRSVARLRLSDATTMFLKPRSDGLQHLLGAVLDRVDAAGTPLGLRYPTIVERVGYTWAREVRSGDCADDAAVDAYFRRAGALLRVTQALGSTDLHHENFIPTPELPVLVDLETVVAPGPLSSAPPPDAVSARLSDTPGRTSMVTSVVAGPPGRVTADLGALAGPDETLTPYAVRTLVREASGPTLRSDRMPMQNGTALPRRGGRPVSLRGHEQALIEGYTEVQRRLGAIIEQEGADSDLLPPLDPEPAVRFVARPTRTYVRLLEESTAPNALVDGVEREFVLERLYRATGTAPPGLIACEVEAMRNLDVPLFTVPFTRTDLVGDGGTVLPDVLSEAPDTQTRNRLRAVISRTDHADDLRATLFSMDPDERPAQIARATDVANASLGPEEAVSVLLDRAIETGDGWLAWIGLEHDPNRNRWTYGRVGVGLTGQAGIGLALATVAARSANAPAGCATAARAALLGSVDGIQRRSLGPTDAFSGPAGVLYAAAVAARLLDDPVLLDAARSLVVPCLRAARRREPSAVIDGTAGAVLALLHLPEDAAVAAALTELSELADLPGHLPEVDRPDHWSWSLPSRTYGTALAAHRLALLRGHSGALPALPTPAGPGDRIAGATAQPPPCPTEPVAADASLRTLLDEALLAQAALTSRPENGWAMRRDLLVDVLVTRRARTGRWAAPLLAPDSTWLSPVHGLAALATLFAGPGAPIVRALA